MVAVGRNWESGTAYRYGFNGVEKTTEVSGERNHYEFKFREYDPRIGKFWSIDPLAASYPWNSPYAFAENRVIDGKDLEGLEWSYYGDDGKQIDIIDKTTNEDKLKITGVRWAGYDVDDKGNKTPKAGTVATAYTFGVKGMATSSVNSEGNGVQTWQSYESLSTGDKTADKNISTLDPIVQDQMKKLVLMGRLRFEIDVRGAGQGGFRTYAEQDELYKIGRTTQLNRKPVTYAKGGQSNHNFGLAMDIAIFENGKYLTVGNEWQYKFMGTVGKTKIQLEWGGDWEGKKYDPAHFQNMQGYSMDQLRALPKDENGYIIK